MTIAPTLNTSFNQTVIPDAVSTYKAVGDFEVIQRTPVVGGTLVRYYNFAAGRQCVDGFLVNGDDKKFLGTKDIMNMDNKAEQVEAIKTMSAQGYKIPA